MRSPSPPIASTEDTRAEQFRRAAAGDEEVLGALHRARHPALCRLAAGLLGRVDLAEDVVQDAWIHVLALLADERLEPALADAALRRTIVRQASSLLRRQRRREGLLRIFGQMALRPAAPSGASDPLLGDRLTDALRALPEALRVPFLLRELEGWTSPEIANALGLKTSAVDQRLTRARRQLKDALQREGVAPQPEDTLTLQPSTPRGER